MKKVLWISRHGPLAVQMRELHAMHGDDCEVIHRDIGNSAQVAAEFQSGIYVDIVCVVPLVTLDHICREGVRPLWADMVETPSADGRGPDLAFGVKRFWFAGFRRVTGVSLELETPAKAHVAPVTLLRVTRHAMTNDLDAYESTLGVKVQVVEAPESFRDARDILERMRQVNAGDVLVVAPYSVYDQLVKAGVKPLFAKMDGLEVVSIHRVTGVRIDFE